MTATILYYAGVIILGAVAQEFIHFRNNQHTLYNSGRSISEQISAWMANRWDDVLASIGIGAIVAVLAFNTDPNTIINDALHWFGVEKTINFKLSHYALAALSALFSDKIINLFFGKRKENEG